MDDLFGEDRTFLPLDPGACLLGGFALANGPVLLDAIATIAAVAPFRHLETPGGRRMSVAMTNAGRLGWVSDRRGYRYDEIDPCTGKAWPKMPLVFTELSRHAAATADFQDFMPEACLINRYEPGAKLSLHQDRDERNLDQPIVSVSLGVDARFLWGGEKRLDRPRRIILQHGDVVVWGGPARLTFHGIDTLDLSSHPATGSFRFNLTFRKAT
ncbi:DNA oxidative demethylase AlkB [Acidiphilium sp.]|uniref:DNA oxidative demethylase AlkB n=1 Tax=Acidiphilium sp. TaxID=527 RepID=UPI003D0804E9